MSWSDLIKQGRESVRRYNCGMGLKDPRDELKEVATFQPFIECP